MKTLQPDESAIFFLGVLATRRFGERKRSSGNQNDFDAMALVLE
jgi:hypothetical protein